MHLFFTERIKAYLKMLKIHIGNSKAQFWRHLWTQKSNNFVPMCIRQILLEQLQDGEVGIGGHFCIVLI